MRYHRPLALGCFASALGFSLAARAVEQPDGTELPQLRTEDCDGNVSLCVNAHEIELGGAGDIDVVEQATIDQQTFNPLCQLDFQVIGRGAAYQNTFGWYSVTRDADGNAVEPALEDLHVFLGCDDAIGTERTLSVPLGTGEIGFFLANNGGECVVTQDDPLGPVLTEAPTNLFFSQPEFNPDGDGLIHMLEWQSRANPEAFYFGWEDLNGGGDNDFEDLLTIVTGLERAGGGEPCTAEGDGVCAQGVMQCRDGELVCVPTQEAREERCNALDDDCDGETDEGDLCEEDKVCYRGECVPRCSSSEFPCRPGLACNAAGFCVDPACVDLECPEGSVCVGGECVGACDDVVCPYGQNCRQGVCVDVCAGLECDPGYACEVRSRQGEYYGVCSSCDCQGCSEGYACADHLCIEDSCASVDCGPGQYCASGECVDACLDAACPRGQVCAQGACVADPSSEGGAGGAAGAGNGTGGIVLIRPGSAGAKPADDEQPHGGAASEEGGAPSDDGGGDGDDDGGCGCRTVSGGSRSSGVVAAAFALLGLWQLPLRRRRAARTPRSSHGG
jgi:hypothetical protein